MTNTRPQLEMRRGRFMVLEENLYHRGIMGEALRALGAGAIENCGSVAVAVDRARLVAPTVVLFEWELTEINGIEFAKLIRAGQTPLKADIPLIIVTSRSTREDVETARAAGVDEYLVKPFTTQALELRLREVFHNRREFVRSIVYTGPCRRRKFLMDYEGPKRRLMDDEEDDSAQVQAEMQIRKSLAKAKVQDAQKLARALSPGDRQQIRKIFVAARELESIALEIADPLLSSAATSLSQYIAAVGASPRFDSQVIEAHLNALAQLLNLSNVEAELREKVAGALAALVQKKITR